MSISHLRVMYFVCHIAISLIAISSSTSLHRYQLQLSQEGKRFLGMRNNERSVCVARREVGSDWIRSRPTVCNLKYWCRECDRKILHRDTRTPSFARCLSVRIVRRAYAHVVRYPGAVRNLSVFDLQNGNRGFALSLVTRETFIYLDTF